MKKVLFVLASAIAVFACQKAEEQSKDKDVIPQESVTEEPVNIFSLSVSMYDTKTIINGQDDIQFEEGELLAVTAEDNSIITLTAQSTGNNVTFSGNIGSKTIGNGAWCVYPAAYMPSHGHVEYIASHTASQHMQVPMAGVIVSTAGESSAKTATASMKHIGGIVKIGINDVPSAATTLEFTAKKGDDSINLTGTYTLGFSDGNPTLSSATSTGTTVSYAISGGGSKTFYVPIPNVACDYYSYSLKAGATTIFTKTKDISKNESPKPNTFGTRASYYGVKAVDINPTVYIHSHFSGWGSTTDIAMGKSESTYSKTIQTIGDQKFRVMVRYTVGESPVDIEMGHSSSDDDTMKGGTFVNVNAVAEASRKNAKISSAPGTYTLSYNNTTGSYSITKVSDSFTPYLIGANYGNWSLSTVVGNASYAVTDKDVEGKYYKIGIIGKYKFVYNSSWYSSLGPNNDSQETAVDSGSKMFKYNDTSSNSFGADNEISFIIFSVTSSSKQYNYFGEGGTSGGQGTTMRVNGSWSWDSGYKTGTTFNASYSQLSTVSVAMTKDQEFCVEFYKSDWGKPLNRLFRSDCKYQGGNDASGNANLSNADGDYNFKVKNAGTYLFIMNDNGSIWNYKVIRTS